MYAMARDAETTESENRPAERTPRKDRLVQARVPRELEETLKEEARRRRLTVSHLVRNVLEDTFNLVDGVVQDVDRIVSDSLTLARSLGGRAGLSREAEMPKAAPAARPADDLSHIYAWNEVVLHRSVLCSSCGGELRRGERAHAGLSDELGAARAWLCKDCITNL
jgi:hypothetical protein